MKPDANLEKAIAYIHGRIAIQIETFAQSLGLPASDLAARVGTLLFGQTGREPLGPEDRMPFMHRETAKGGKTVEPLAVASRTRSKAPVKAQSKIKNYWANMTPEQRQAEMKRRQRKWSPEAKAKWRKEGR